jgi:AraC-like DNA-binding protein
MSVYDALIRKQAIIRPSGLPGAVVAGFYQVVQHAYPVEVFTSVGDALDWFGWPKAHPLAVEVDALWTHAVGHSPIVRRLRTLLETDVSGVTLASAARSLAISERTLQRHLRDSGTNFQSELAAARIHAAQSKMVHTDLKLTAIALEVGCSSLQHFSTLFRKATGETPSAWRARMASSGKRLSVR